ncbi:DNA protecting protein DprA [Labedella gwakjiensis]|uniref:DNA protecting protein DprA n=1 Tax=Labedella gwakjiensis TaxID=390269 RepID=A0A2P8H0M8_9MICO|nr:DNA-processing protein DprA [Labedella gwakjiensis]PSL39772.1 DNA protecting protein DprA [Labedella gwakjiensis]
MTLLGFSDDRVAELAAAIADGPQPVDSDPVGWCEDLIARAAWSCVAEPGDGAAGGVVAAIGAATSLRLLTSSGATRRLRSLCAERGLEDVTEAVVAAWRSGAARWAARLDPTAVERSIDLARRTGARLATPGAPSWPTRLDDLGVHGPTALWVRGRRLAAEFDRSIALVGARAATGYGEHVTMDAASGLVDRGFTVISGAAYGIDGAAHRAALADGGTTVAFLAGGVDRPYPSGHTSLISRIAEVGAVYAEVPCGVAPTKWRFLQRNRLIAAASAATVVLEAGARSGSLNTAGHAASLGRPLGAVPGPVTSVASAGCHRLLREYHATCVTTAAEMAELVGPPVVVESAVGATASAHVLGALRLRRVTTVAELVTTTGLTTRDVQSALGLLDLDGSVIERGDGWVRR